MRLGIFGGTFNPIHVGHLRAAEEVRERLGLDTVVFVPSSLPPHKELDHGVPGPVRLAMVEASIRGNPCFQVSPVEVERSGPSYSLLTIEHFRSLSGSVPYFLIGQDAFNEISSWHRAKEVLAASHFAVMTRPGAPRPPVEKIIPEGMARFRPNGDGYVSEHGTEIIFVEVTQFAVSSSMVRRLCREGRSVRYLVSDGAHDIMTAGRIYRT
ncbi:MAG TPA: nicotinate-nucleotide adenylyltransferase [Deltaproteobacteria bacterium]|nr:nicotinate-nucleotide adenylyltransferase [Deltaproteobacteria bacterium]HPP80199.1 nicotinate-nucleotide adenylyltransferase [Deltaproteobacteria bacterium]